MPNREGGLGPDRRTPRPPAGAHLGHRRGDLRLPRARRARLPLGGFGGALNAPAGTDAAAGNAIVSPSTSRSRAPTRRTSSSPTAKPVWDDPAEVADRRAVAAILGAVPPARRAAQPQRDDAEPVDLRDAPRPARHAERPRPAGAAPAWRSRRCLQRLPVHGAVRQPRRPHDPVRGHASRPAASRRTAALNATPRDPRHRRRRRDAARAPTASGVAGEAAALYDVSSTSNHDLIHIVPVAILAIGLLLALVLRSLVAPLYLIVSVAHLLPRRARRLDDRVHRPRRQRRADLHPAVPDVHLPAGAGRGLQHPGHDPDPRGGPASGPLREAVVRAVGRTGPTVTSAGLVLAGTFGVLAVAGRRRPERQARSETSASAWRSAS